ncbi:hypothetical protein [Synechococcus sp. A15-127]|uniref:hypothetical protein n=1 Tax=Synechococcus sp. A15-127 TaxID=1050624 RepID=UPI001646EE13|nr:hypothetical protein [Synechococcus sp. A15-127]
METGSTSDVPVARKPRFWVGPLLAGCCFTLGYGITHRLVTLQSNPETPEPELFAPAEFPGDSLRSLRDRHGQTSGDLQVDVAAIEARLEAERKAEEEARLEAERRVEESLQLNQAFQPVLEEARWEEKPLLETVPEERNQSDFDPLLGSTIQPVATDESPPQPSSILLPLPEPVLPVVPAPSDPPVMAP